MHDPRVVAVPLEQFGAVGEEGGLGQDVILQDNPLLHLFKKPLYGRRTAAADAEVALLDMGPHLARPVDGRGDLQRPAALLRILGMVGAGAVLGNKKSRRARGTDSLEDSRRQFGPGEDDEEHGWRRQLHGTCILEKCHAPLKAETGNRPTWGVARGSRSEGEGEWPFVLVPIEAGRTPLAGQMGWLSKANAGRLRHPGRWTE